MEDLSPFSGFTDGAFRFFEKVQPEVSFEFVQEQQPEWERFVHVPMEARLAELSEEFGDGYAWHLHRDPWLWRHQMATIDVADTIGYRLELSIEGLRGSGGWMLSDAGQVARYRAAVGSPEDVGNLPTILETLRGTGFEIGGNRLKTAPRGIAVDHPRIGLLRNRTLIASRWIDPAILSTADCATQVRAAFRELRELVEWFVAHVGPRDGRA
ncbi:MAG TPA: DUF2461 family protein [Actinomycetota bacterium]|jgi:uncharacterized protein (DUF2461 family)|nr:DUF2461 family protein [Actinomycetota bacterium]